MPSFYTVTPSYDYPSEKLYDYYQSVVEDARTKKRHSHHHHHHHTSFWSRTEPFADINYHGFSYLYKSKNPWMRSFWICVVVAATTVAIYLTCMNVKSYFTSSNVSKISHMSARNISQPAITICDESTTYFLNKTRLDADGVTDEAIQLMLLTGPTWFRSRADVPDPYVTTDRTAVAFKNRLIEQFGSEVEALQGFYLRYGASCESVFHSCRNAKYQKLDCCEIFKPIMNFRHGLCFASKFGVLRSNAAGLFSSIFIRFNRLYDLWVPPNSRPYLAGDVQLQHTVDVFIRTGISQGMWHSEVVVIGAGEWQLLRLSLSRIQHQPSKDRACVEKPDLSYFADYSFTTCMWEKSLLKNKNFALPDNCILPMVFLTKLGLEFGSKKPAKTSDDLENGKKANTDLRTGRGNIEENSDGQSIESAPSGRPLCTPKQILSSVFNFTEDNSRLVNGHFESIAYWMDSLDIGSEDLCPPVCDRWIYKYSEHEALLEDPTKNTSGLTLMIVDYEYPVIKDVPALEWYEYISFIGGTWGLWCGTSLLTIVQIVYSCFLMAWKAEKKNLINMFRKIESTHVIHHKQPPSPYF